MTTKKKSLFFFIIYVFIVSTVYGFFETYDYPEPTLNSSFNFYSNNRLSFTAAGRGYTGVADVGALDLAFINPASINLKTKFSIFYELSKKDDADYYFDSLLKPYKSSNVYGGGMKITDKLQFGILKGTRNSYDWERGYVYYVNSEGEIIDSLYYYSKVDINTLTIPVSYYFRNIIKVGISLEIDKYKSNNAQAVFNSQTGDLIPTEGDFNFKLARGKIGAIVTPSKYYSFGISFLPEEKRQITKDIGNYGKIKYKENIFPATLTLGAEYSFRKFPLDVFLDYNFENTSKDQHLLDMHNFNIGLDYFYKTFFRFQLGFFTQFDYRNTDEKVTIDGEEFDYWPEEEFAQYFGTLGFQFFWKNVNINFSIMTSELFSSADVSEVYIKSGISFGF